MIHQCLTNLQHCKKAAIQLPQCPPWSIHIKPEGSDLDLYWTFWSRAKRWSQKTPNPVVYLASQPEGLTVLSAKLSISPVHLFYRSTWPARSQLSSVHVAYSFRILLRRKALLEEIKCRYGSRCWIVGNLGGIELSLYTLANLSLLHRTTHYSCCRLFRASLSNGKERGRSQASKVCSLRPTHRRLNFWVRDHPLTVTARANDC